ncbi:MAG: GGDEF domain-containing protein [Syntrophomonadaceae bacterium]|nr:GGDEF domain-containing protein [Syntrophomonadaceae bacterium]
MNYHKNIIAIRWISILVLSLVISTIIDCREDNAVANQLADGAKIVNSFASINDGGAYSLSLSLLPLLTEEEKEYIANAPVIKAGTINGVAPLIFLDEKGNIQGVFQKVLQNISEISGLKFECTIYDSGYDLMNSDVDIIYGISTNYAQDYMLLSDPFLETETVLYINSSVNPDELANKILAAVMGSAPLEEIKEENIIYYNNREESLNAVERGQADYGYGNAYSVAYYTLRNGYKNIITVPISKESREYSIAVLNNDELLLSILNKSISLIDANQMYTMILDEASHIERKRNFSMLIDLYGRQIAVAIFTVLTILLVSILTYIRINRELREQNQKFKVLSQISNEYRYEYIVKKNQLRLSEKFKELFTTKKSLEEVSSTLKNVLSIPDYEWTNEIIDLSLPNGERKTFKVIKSNTLNYRGTTELIIGKLIDVSEEIAEKEELLIKSQLDGLTGLYNPATTKALINEWIAKKESHTKDVFILIDCDEFKNVNDTYGHLAGDKVLVHVAHTMKQTFRNTDILGRLGGDELCVYMKDIASLESTLEKCQNLITRIGDTTEIPNFSVSIGIVLV